MFVFPMAGLSSRFAKAGYALPKYMLDACGKSVFYYVLSGFRKYFESETFLFICRDVAATASFVEKECKVLGIASFKIVILDGPTEGQAETVFLGLSKAAVSPEEPITIFNIDTIYENFCYPEASLLANVDGYLEVFRADGDMWSFARTVSDIDMRVVETAEKIRISPFCSTGLYYFKKASFFVGAYNKEALKPREQWAAKELYVAPLYNDLIGAGMKVIAVEISSGDLIPCGTPEEYEAFKLKMSC